MKFNLIGVPVNYGCDREGVQYGPEKFRENNIVELIKEEGHEAHDLGDVMIPIVSSIEKYAGHEKLKFLNPIAEINNSLANKVYNSLVEGAFPFVMGGDHSLGIGSIAGASKYFNELAVIWIDAHGDINTGDTSPTGNIHGMPLAAAMNVGDPVLTNIYYKGQKVKPENVYIIGGRDIDPGEFELAKKLKLNLYTMETVREEGLNNVLDTIIEKIRNSNVDGVHLSFDIDGLDKAIVPGTGTAVDEGFNLEEGKVMFTSLLGEGCVTSMDFVELNPLLDDADNKTIINCMELIRHIFKSIEIDNEIELKLA